MKNQNKNLDQRTQIYNENSKPKKTLSQKVAGFFDSGICVTTLIALTSIVFHLGGSSGEYLTTPFLNEPIKEPLTYVFSGFLSTLAYSTIEGKLINECIKINRSYHA